MERENWKKNALDRDISPHTPTARPRDFRAREDRTRDIRLLRITHDIRRRCQEANLPPVGSDVQPRLGLVLLWILHDPLIRLIDIRTALSDRGAVGREHEVPQRHDLEAHDVGLRLSGLDPGLVRLEDPVAGRVGADVAGEFRVAAEAGAGLLDGFFKGLVLRLGFHGGVDFAAGGKTVELRGDVDAEFSVDIRVGVFGPNVL